MSDSIRNTAARPLRAYLWLSLIALSFLILLASMLRVQSEKGTMERLLLGFIERISKNVDAEGNTLFLQREIEQMIVPLEESGVAKVGIELRLNGRLVASRGETEGLGFPIEVQKSQRLTSGSTLDSVIVIDGLGLLGRYLLVPITTMLVLLATFYFLRQKFFGAVDKIVDPIECLCRALSSGDGSDQTREFAKLRATGINEVRELVESFERFLKRFEDDQRRIAELRQGEAIAQLTKQVAHDIRSPISALNMAMTTAREMPADSRMLMGQAVQRISSIAEDLLATSRRHESKYESAVIADVIVSIIEEKRALYRHLPSIKIVLDIEEGLGLKVQISATELGRVLSNLIDNSVEALSTKEGTVVVTLKQAGHFTQIIIEDDGVGIPEEIKNSIGQRGVSHGKDGNGLGVAHARETAERVGGRLEISSVPNVGTKVILSFPR